MKNKQENKNKVILIRVTDELYQEFNKFCEDNCYQLSKRLRYLITKDLKENKNEN